MAANDHPLAEEAEALLAPRFARLRPPTAKRAVTRCRGTPVGAALERMKDIFVWAEAYAAEIEDVEINNPGGQGQPYAPDQPASSAVNTDCGGSTVGNRADNPRRARHRRTGALSELVRFGPI